jgi:hypothetical protein
MKTEKTLNGNEIAGMEENALGHIGAKKKYQELLHFIVGRTIPDLECLFKHINKSEIEQKIKYGILLRTHDISYNLRDFIVDCVEF